MSGADSATPIAPAPELRVWLWRYVLVWAFIFVNLLLAILALSGRPLGLSIAPTLAIALPGALLGLVSLRLARWWPLGETSAPAFAGRHVLLCVVWVAASMSLWQLVRVIESRILGTPLLPVDRGLVFWTSVINGLAHIVMTAIGYVWKGTLELRAQQARMAESDRLRSKAELALMRTQLNPHFLLNTLHAVMGLVRRDPALAEQAIETLGDLVKTGQRLQTAGDMVLLQQEWDFVTRYLELEKLRFGDRLRTTLEASADALDTPVPPFSLLPLVENAVIHGVGRGAEGGEVRVRCLREGGLLAVSVEDTGRGASDEVIFQSPRLGLRLLRERLAHLYPSTPTLRFSRYPGGFRAEMTLPLGQALAD